MPIDPQVFADALEDLRIQHTESQEDAARRIGISNRQYVRWAAKESVPYLSSIEKVADAYDVPIAQLLGPPRVTAGDVASHLEALEGKIDQLGRQFAGSVAALEAELAQLAREVRSNGKTPGAKSNRRKAS